MYIYSRLGLTSPIPTQGRPLRETLFCESMLKKRLSFDLISSSVPADVRKSFSGNPFFRHELQAVITVFRP